MPCKPSQEVAVPDKVLATFDVQGILCPVVRIYDCFGEATSRADAASIVVELPNESYIGVEVAPTDLGWIQ